MIPSEIFSVAIDALRANKLRAFLTTLGVVIGSACIVLVVTVAQTGRRYVIAQIEGVGSNIVYAEAIRQPGQSSALSYEITPDDMQTVKASIPQVVEVAGTQDEPMSVVVNGAERAVAVVGVTEGFLKIRNLLILQGRFFDPADMESRSKVCLITKNLAQRAFPQQDPVGQGIRIGELRFTIIGVFQERVATFGLSEIQSDSVLIPFTVIEYFTGDNYVKTLYAQVDQPENVAQVTSEVRELLKSRHPVGASYAVENLSSILEAARKISLALSVVLLVIALITLLISGIGIMNIMLVTVTERTREIGIRKAIGATRREILYQFLMEALLISGAGAIAGILIGVLIPTFVQPLLPGNLRLPISWLSVVGAFVISCATGVFFGYLPADKAARLEPVESLRYE